jgi:hypothetical protein
MPSSTREARMSGNEERKPEPQAVPEGAFTVNEDYQEPAGKKAKKAEEPAPVQSPVDEISTIDKYVEQFHSDLLPVHRAGIIGHHAGKILRHSEWKAILLDELTRRA